MDHTLMSDRMGRACFLCGWNYLVMPVMVKGSWKSVIKNWCPNKKKGKKYSGFCCSYFEKGVYFGRSIFSKSILYSFKKLLNLNFWLEWLLKVIVWAGLTKTCNEINWLKKQIIIGIEVSQILQMQKPD